MKKLAQIIFTLCFLLVFSRTILFVRAEIPALESDSDASGRWMEMLQAKANEFKEYSSLIDIYEQIVSRECLALKRQRENAEMRNYQIKFLSLANVYSPSHFRTMRKEYKKSAGSFLKQLDRVRHFQATTERYKKIFREMLDDLVSMERKAGQSFPREIGANIKRNIEEISSRMDKTQQLIDDSVFDSEKLEKNIKDYLETLDGNPSEKIRYYYLERRRLFIPLYSWKFALNEISIGSKDIWRSFIRKMPDTMKELRKIGLIFIFCGIPLITVSLFIRKKFSLPSIQDAVLSRTYETGIAGLLLLFSSYSAEFPASVTISRISMIFLIFSIVDFSWLLTLKRHPELNRAWSPLLIIGGLVSINIVCEIFDIFEFSYSLLWPLAMLIFIALFSRVDMSRLPKPYPLMKKILLILLLIDFALSVSGYLVVSPLLVFAQFTISVGICIALDLSFFAREYMSNKKGFLSRKSVRAVTLGLGIPIIWAFIAGSCLFLIGEEMFASEVVMHFLAADVNLGFVHVSIFKLGLSVFFFFVFRTAIKILQETGHEFAFGQIDAATIDSLRAVLASVLWGLYALILLYLLGVSFTSITVVAGGLSLGIGFGLQNIVNNFVSGIIIIFGGTVRKGDIIQIDGIMAKVTEINVRSTTIQTFDNAIIAVPNSDILTSKITNWTRNDPIVKREIKVGVAYGSNVEQVRKILLEIANSNPNVCKSPEPLVLFKEFGDSTLNFTLFVWLHIEKSLTTLSDLHCAIEKRFREEGISIAFPQLEIHVKNLAGIK